MVGHDRDIEPAVLRLLPLRIGRQREIWIGKAAHGDPTQSRVAIAFPIQIAAAIGAEVKADPVAAIAVTLVNVSRTLKPHAVLQIGRAQMEGGAGSALASLAVAQINRLGLARNDHPQRPAMAFCRSLPKPRNR